jgi:hypothetical protein
MTRALNTESCIMSYNVKNEFNSTNLEHNATYHNNSSYKLRDQHNTYIIVM